MNVLVSSSWHGGSPVPIPLGLRYTVAVIADPELVEVAPFLAHGDLCNAMQAPQI